VREEAKQQPNEQQRNVSGSEQGDNCELRGRAEAPAVREKAKRQPNEQQRNVSGSEQGDNCELREVG